MNLTAHFTVEELSKSETALRLGFDNCPPAAELAALLALCTKILEPLRAEVGPIHINSGYRGPEANKAVGGAASSRHTKGEAADIEVPGRTNLSLARTVVAMKLPFDQLILEFYSASDPSAGWVHVSHRATEGNRGEVLCATRSSNGKTVYTHGLP